MDEESIFAAALEKETPQERAAFLDGVCLGDSELRGRIEALLAADKAASRFLAPPEADIPATHDSSLPEQTGTQIGPYKLLQQIGEGGFGQVYMAEQKEPVRRKVALKIIKPGMDTKEVIARFEAERQALAMMDHPNIAKVLDAGATESGRPYFVMELVRGISITKFCDKNSLTTQARLQLFIPVCQAIQHAHQKAIIHRDIKPSNVLVTMHDDRAVPKVIDFGIAKATQSELTAKTVFTQFQQFIGTPVYMSPEQAQMSGLDIDTRCDVYALGVLLYELLTGSTPFDSKELLKGGYDEICRRIREQEPPKPSSRVSTLDPDISGSVAKSRQTDPNKLRWLIRGDLDWIIMKAMEKDRTRRYETANGLAQDVGRFLSNEPVSAVAPSSFYRFRKFARRNRTTVITASTFAVVLILATIVTSWQAHVASRQRDMAEWARSLAENAQQEARTSQRRAIENEQLAREQTKRANRSEYAAIMNLIQNDWEQHNAGRLLTLLNDTSNHSERGFEWYLWQQRLHRSLKTFRGHLNRVGAIAVSRDGRLIATASNDQTVKVWDRWSGKEKATLQGHTAWVRSVAFFPDGERVLSSSDDMTTRIWDIDNRRELMVIQGHTTDRLFSALSPDGRLIVTGSFDGNVKIWDSETGEQRREFNTQEDIWALNFSPDSQRVAIGSFSSGVVRIEDFEREGETVWFRHPGRVFSVAFSSNGRWIVTANTDSTAKVWDTSDGTLMDTLAGHKAWVLSAAFSPDGTRIVTASGDGTAKVWDWNGERATEAIQLSGHRQGVFCATFLPENSPTVVTGSQAGTARLWDVTTSEPRELRHRDEEIGSPVAVSSVAFLRSGQSIVSGSQDGVARIWNVETREVERKFAGLDDQAVVVAAAPGGEWIVTGSDNGTANVWDVATGRNRLGALEHEASVKAVVVSPDGQWIATGSADTVKLWNALDGTLERSLTAPAVIKSLAFSTDGRLIVAAGGELATAWIVATGEEAFRPLPGPDTCLAISSNGLLVMGGWDDLQKGLVDVWDLSSSPPKKSYSLTGNRFLVRTACFSPDGRRIVTGSWGDAVKFWDTSTGRELLTLTVPSGGDVHAVAFSSDGKRFAAVCPNSVVRVWTSASEAQVAAWRDEEREAARQWKELQRERQERSERQREHLLHDEGAIKHWRVLGPIVRTAEEDQIATLDQEQIRGEAQLKPSEGETFSIGNETMQWRDVPLEDHRFDLYSVIDPHVGRAVAYAVCYLHSRKARSGLRLITQNRNFAKIYLNDEEVYRRTCKGLDGGRDTAVNLQLKAGVNVFVLKSVSSGDSWRFSLRLTDENGGPVEGIKTLSEPTMLDADEDKI